MRTLSPYFVAFILLVSMFGCKSKSVSRDQSTGGVDVSSGGSGGDGQAAGGEDSAAGGSGGEGGHVEVCPSDIADCDDDGVSVVDGDCDDDDPNRFPGNMDTCNGTDNNCSGDESDACSSVGCNEINLAAPIVASSACLTSGTGAQLVVQVELQTRDLASIDDGNVHFVSNQQGVRISESHRNGDTFYAVVTATEGELVDVADAFEVSAVAACGGDTEVAFENVLTVSRAPSVRDMRTLVTTLATGGCSPLDGNVRVHVRVDDTGMPIQGASVMVGSAENNLAFYEDATAWVEGEDNAKRSNVKATNAQGQVLFTDFSDALAGSLDVSVAAEGYDNVTVLASAASDILILLRRLDTELPERQEFTGQLQGQMQGAEDDNITSLGAVLPALPFSAWPTFSGLDLIREYQCWTPRPASSPDTFFKIPNLLFIPAQGAGLGLFRVEDNRLFNLILPGSGVSTSLAIFGEVDLGNSIGSIAEGGIGVMLDILSTLDVQHGGVFDSTNVADPNNVTVQVGGGPDQVGRCTIENAPNIPQGFSASCAGFWSLDTQGDQEFVLPAGFSGITHEELADSDEANVNIDVNVFSNLEGIPNAEPMAVAMLTDTSPTQNGFLDKRSSSIIQRGGFVDDGNGRRQMQANDFLYPMVNYRFKKDADDNPLWFAWDSPESDALGSAEVSYCQLSIEAALAHVENEPCGRDGNEVEESELVHRIPLHRFYFDEDTTQIPVFSRPSDWHQLDEQTLEQMYQSLGLDEQEDYRMYFISTISCHAHTDLGEFDLQNQVLDRWFNNYTHLSLSKRHFPYKRFPPREEQEE